jgi:gamma-glutamyltranspeptidase/glutathione hydrolase
VIEALNVLAGRDLASLGHGTPEWADLLLRVYRLVWRDRLQRLGDTAAARADLDRLLSADHAAELRRRLSERGRPAAPDAWRGGPGTIHVSAADGDGNLVALTQSLIGGSHFVADLGLLMNQSLIMFDPRPGHPNGPGPRKQPLVNMSPTIITRAGRPVFALGAPGARHIISAVSQIVVNLVDFEMEPSEALSAPRVHCEAAGPALVEACADTSLRTELRAKGYDVSVVKQVGCLGHVAGVDHAAQCLVGATDPRHERSKWDGRVGTVGRL